MDIRELINRGAVLLKNNSESPRLDSNLLLASTLGMDRAKLLASYPDVVSKDKETIFLDLINRRSDGFPVSYLLNEKEFYGQIFYIEEGVLTPRPDTEILVETTLNLIDKHNLKTALDMCTGTGCIAISLQNEQPELNVIATDISPIAEKVFGINNKKLVNNKVNFIHSNLFQNLDGRHFDIIATNPPYLTKKETDDRIDIGWKEPALALDGGDDGLDLVRDIIKDSPKYLNKNGWLLIEAASAQMLNMKDEMEKNSYTNIEVYKDLAGLERIIVGQHE
ncbi:MAG: peptide chain release factor N(5)-glutamine methyltransferase [Spirochaetaceae bacterium]